MAGQTIKKPVTRMSKKTVVKESKEAEYTVLLKDDALAMTAEVIDKYRPALEKLAE